VHDLRAFGFWALSLRYVTEQRKPPSHGRSVHPMEYWQNVTTLRRLPTQQRLKFLLRVVFSQNDSLIMTTPNLENARPSLIFRLNESPIRSCLFINPNP
jgi:hypothetical protein